MTMAPTEMELWAHVCRLSRQRGDAAWRYLADRIGEMLMAGDEAGVRRWRDLEDRLRDLRRGGSLH